MKLPADSPESEGPNLTPVIDVVFLLLIFFLVATEYHDAERELDITLPEVAQAQPLAQTRGGTGSLPKNIPKRNWQS